MTVGAPTTTEPVAVADDWARRWAGLRWRWRIVIAVLVAIVAVEVAQAVGLGTSGTPSAPGQMPSSSYTTAPDGLRAWGDLLGRYGHRVTRVDHPLAAGGVPAGATVVVADAVAWSTTETDAVRGLLRSGHRVVVAGQPPHGLLAALVPAPPRWSAVPSQAARVVRQVPETAGVARIDPGVDAAGSWRSPSPATAVAEGPGGTLVTVSGVGRGRLVLIASSAALSNARLVDADNAAFALDLAGPAGGDVAFDEYAHGFGTGGQGLGGLPGRWRWGLGIGAAALGMWLWSASKRFGPPRRLERAGRPPRVAYVDALAATVAAASPAQWPAAVAPLRGEARRRLCSLLGVTPDATDAAIVQAAAGTAVPGDVVDAVVRTPTSAQEVVETGRAWTWLQQAGGRRR